MSLEPLGKCIFNLFLLLSLPRSNKGIMPERQETSQSPRREAITYSFALPLKSGQIRILCWQHLLLLVSGLFCLSSSQNESQGNFFLKKYHITWPTDQFYSRLLQQTDYPVWIAWSQLDYKCMIDWKYLQMNMKSGNRLPTSWRKIRDISLRYKHANT